MVRYLKKGIIFAIVIICALSIVSSSSGISQFKASRGVAMRVVDSENAFISLPETIELDINVLRQITNYYKVSTIYVSEKTEDSGDAEKHVDKDGITETNAASDNVASTEDMEMQEILIPVEVKEFIESVEEISITDIKDNVVVKNNMPHDIRLEKIEIDNPMLEANGDNWKIEVGERFDIDFDCDVDEVVDLVGLIDDKDVEQVEAKATLYFSWDKGQSIIYKDVIIDIEIEDKTIEETI